MAKVMYARLCRKIKRDRQTGSYTLMGSFATLPLAHAPISFVLVVYWAGANEAFQQSFVIADADGNLLDQTPATECVLKDKQTNLSTAFFHVAFPQAGLYHIDVLRNGIWIESIPFQVGEVQQTDGSTQSHFAPLGKLAQS